jgi:hypothetical protein
MSDKAAIKLERGAKRTCQNPDCGARFYDLNRDPITCPICNTVYVIALRPSPETPARGVPRLYRKPPPLIPDEPKQKVPAKEAELATLEGEEGSAPSDEDETLIEEVDEDSPDMSDIVDAPAADDDDKA